MKKIKPWRETGAFQAHMMVDARAKFERVLEDRMRMMGTVPVIDMQTEWYVEYNDEKDIYDFILVMYGVYVGKRKAVKEVYGWSQEEGKAIIE